MTILVYAGFFQTATEVSILSALLAFALIVLCMMLLFSLFHEALHGHPIRNPKFSALLIFPSLYLHIPYLELKDLQLGHHRDAFLSYPYDGPENNLWILVVGIGFQKPAKNLMSLNNTFVGRMVISPLLGQWDSCAKMPNDCTKGYARRPRMGTSSSCSGDS